LKNPIHHLLISKVENSSLYMQHNLMILTEQLKGNSSNLNSMSATMENPGTPLVASNGQPNYTAVDADMERGSGLGKKKQRNKKWSK